MTDWVFFDALAVEQADFAKKMVEATCEHRMGKASELGFAIATIADERNGYLCGVDVLIDGGALSGKKFQAWAWRGAIRATSGMRGGR